MNQSSIDAQAQKGQEWLTQLLALMGAPGKVARREPPSDVDPASLWLEIDANALGSDRVSTFLANKGEAIDAIQYLLNAIVNLDVEPGDRRPLTVELDGYRQARHAELVERVQQAIAQVRATGQEVELLDLSSSERREVHNLLKDIEDLATESRGQEPDRRLFIKPV